MLVMAWGGESTASMELTPQLLRDIRQSDKEIRALGIFHEDFRRENVLWNEELGRALIIDFHRFTLKRRPILQQPRASKRRKPQPEIVDSKRLRMK
jgi:RIO-like serine/threonine protein kinase